VDLNALKVVTNDTMKALRKYDIITPQLFKEIFFEKAKAHNLTIDPDELDHKTAELTLEKVYALEEQTVESSHLLQRNIDMASTAIDKQDKALLEQVQVQMEELFKRIKILESQLYTDELTKAYNRKWLFEKFLDNERFTHNGTLVFLDIDKFKEINDTYGHITGDKALEMVTQLTKQIEATETVRYGGDEFILISKEPNQHKLEQQMKRLSRTLDHKRFKFQGHTFSIHISYGLITFHQGEAFADVIEKVDKKMYTHKKSKDYVVP